MIKVVISSLLVALLVSCGTDSKITEVSVPQGGCYLVMMTMTNGEVKSERIVLGL